MAKLNQILAIEKGVKPKAHSSMTEIHRLSGKTEAFNGFQREYHKKDDDGEEFPGERKRVQMTVSDQLRQFRNIATEAFDITARKEWSNANAKADVKIDKTVIIANAPVTYLLYLEKQLIDLRTFLNDLPILDIAQEWKLDAESGLYKSAEIRTHKTKKVQKPIVLIQPTPEHPGQAQLITEDITVGYWHQTAHSGAIPLAHKQKLLQRIDELLKATKSAREEANGTEEDKNTPKIGDAIFDFVTKE